MGRRLPAGAVPARVLVIRLHAFGDTAITLPAIAALRDRLPGSRLEVLTDVQSAGVFSGRTDVDAVWTTDTRRGSVALAAALWRLSRALAAPPLAAVVDLQRSRWSVALTRKLAPPAWVAFDRFAPQSALTRYLDALAWIGFGALEARCESRLRRAEVAVAGELLASAGRDPGRPLVCLNPAGGWPTKRWPVERYLSLGMQMRRQGWQLMLLGSRPAAAGLERLRGALAPEVLDFVGRTTPAQAAALLGSTSLIISDDSGLMHLAWAQGVPTVAMFGASRAVWSRPEGRHSHVFASEDLACGACMRPECRRGDLWCLDRVSVDEVLAAGAALCGRAGA